MAEWNLPEEFQTLRRLMEARMLKMGPREYAQVLRLLKTFDLNDLHGAIKDALRLRAVGFNRLLKKSSARPSRLRSAGISPENGRKRAQKGSCGRFMGRISFRLRIENPFSAAC